MAGSKYGRVDYYPAAYQDKQGYRSLVSFPFVTTHRCIRVPAASCVVHTYLREVFQSAAPGPGLAGLLLKGSWWVTCLRLMMQYNLYALLRVGVWDV